MNEAVYIFGILTVNLKLKYLQFSTNVNLPFENK